VTVWDAAGTSAEDSREIAIEEAVNTPPVADPKTVTTAQDTPVWITLSGSDSDGDTVTYAVESQPAHGSLSGSAPDLTYTPDTGYQGSDSFTYTVSDGQMDSAPATVSITVTEEANTPPTAESITTSTTQETAVPVALKGSDADGDELTYSVVGRPAHGGLTGTGPFLTYTPYSGYSGPDSFTYKVGDGRADSETATVSITVDPLRWVWAGQPVANPTNEPTEFYGGGQTPYYYGEPRFEGKFTIYYPSVTSLAMDLREVDHGYEYWNVSLRADLVGPPPVLTPGETVQLTATLSSGGSVTDGNPGVLFWYSGNGISMQPSTAFPYSPWDPEFSGDSVAEYSFDVPTARKGGTFEVYASFWNHPGCLVVWSYRVE